MGGRAGSHVRISGGWSQLGEGAIADASARRRREVCALVAPGWSDMLPSRADALAGAIGLDGRATAKAQMLSGNLASPCLAVHVRRPRPIV